MKFRLKQIASFVGIVSLSMLASCGGSGDSAPTTQTTDSAAIPAGLSALPGEESALAVRIFPAEGQFSRWCVYRGWPDERLHVFLDCGQPMQRAIPFSPAPRGTLLLFQIAESGDQLSLLTYDAEQNIPSGRTSGRVSEGIDVWLLDAKAPVIEAGKIATQLPLGGFDNLIYADRRAAELWACAVNRCFSVADSGATSEWNIAGLKGFEIVEAVTIADSVRAIVRLQDDHATGNPNYVAFEYAHATLRPDGVVLQPIPDTCIPFALESTGGAASWRCVASRADVAELLRREISRMPADGMMDFGVSNLEGRIAWSQAYYLSGLMPLGSARLPSLRTTADWGPLRQRLRAEVGLLASRVNSGDNGLASRRYSLNRTAQTFALHLGRVARILRSASDNNLGSRDSESAQLVLQERLRSMRGTVEEPTVIAFAGQTYASHSYRRGSDFWCDGVNVPYNYVSGYVDGLLAQANASDATFARALELMQPLLQVERVKDSSEWHYWWSHGSNGWSAADDVSKNTPAYGGSPGIAHITYRSMDAMALLRLRAHNTTMVEPAVAGNIRRLVAEGLLLPWLNEALAATEEQAVLAERVRYRYARSAAPWELQGQVWALDQIAAQYPAM